MPPGVEESCSQEGQMWVCLVSLLESEWQSVGAKSESLVDGILVCGSRHHGIETRTGQPSKQTSNNLRIYTETENER